MPKHLALWLLLLVCGRAAVGQTFAQKYFVKRTAVVSGAGEVITIVNPATDRTKLAVRSVYVLCSASCDFSIERDGATPAGSTLAVQKKTSAVGAAVATAFYASSVGSGTSINDYSIFGPGAQAISIADVDLPGNGVNSNFTVRLATFTGKYTIYVDWEQL